MQFNEKCFFVSKKGGSIDYFRPDDGEHVFSLDVPKGRVSAREYVIEGFHSHINHLSVIWPPSAVGVVNPNTFEQSGANPEFSPTSAAWQQKKIAMMVETATADAVARAMAGMPALPSPLTQPVATQPVVSDQPAPIDAEPQISA